jgi:hypothetical protein
MKVAVWMVFAGVILWRSSGVARQAPPTPEIFGDIAGELARETPHFRIYVEKGFAPVDLDWLQVEVETIHAYLSQRMGATTDERFSLTFRPPDTRPCPVRGLAHWGTAVPQTILFADERVSQDQLLGMLAHEIAHLFHFYALKARATDMNLAEGLATWGAGKYWEAWQKASLTEAVRSFKREGRYLPLSDYLRDEVVLRSSTGENCLKDRELRYYSWAAFIDFLIKQHGMEKFRQVLGPIQQPTGPLRLVFPANMPVVIDPARGVPFQLGPPAPPAPPPPTPFRDVYGLSLEELEKAWLEELGRAQ